MAAFVGVQDLQQGQSGSRNLRPLNVDSSNEQGSFADKAAMAPKVRKPYTITKQRQRWTEEEQKKFVEALQLYGRAWRRIEEHIGTKNAVQIRSHAQKFFSKVARVANDNGTSDMKAIDIPPPRPKKKPIHPYHRKQILVLTQLERSSSSVLSVSELENRSPTSVLSAVESESIGAFSSNNTDGCTPQEAFAVGSSDQENGVSSPTSSIEVDDKCVSLGLTSARQQTTEYASAMELDVGSEEHIETKEASSGEASVPALKLFGRMVVVADSRKQSYAKAGVAHKSAPKAMADGHCNGRESDMGKSTEEVIQNGIIRDFPMASTPGGLPPMFYCFPSSYGDAANPAAEARVVPLPWWAFYGNMPFPCAYAQQNLSFSEDVPQHSWQKECSGTGSNTASEEGYVFECQRGGHCCDGKISEAGMAKKQGFMPYRRCASEGELERQPLLSGDAAGDVQLNREAVLCSKLTN